MPKLNPKLFIDEDFDPYAERDARRQRSGKAAKKNLLLPAAEVEALASQQDGARAFTFSYHASRHERQWILESLGGFYEGQWLSDVLRQVKGGKEASVYQCASGVMANRAEFLAAKVFRPRQFRQLKKDHIYREGRIVLDADGNEVLDDGMIHAMHKRSVYGLQVLHVSWIEHEYQALVDLHAAGADVPEPYARGDNAVLMSYIGDAEMPAPILNSIELDPLEARRLFYRVLHNIEIMLSRGRVHADLSAYNILYWDGKITLIDFPQVIRPQDNRNAFRIFERDVTRVCEYFSRQGLRLNPRKLAADLWTANHYRLTPEVHPRLLDDEDEADRAYWQSVSEA
jgi:RIO kinase 1